MSFDIRGFARQVVMGPTDWDAREQAVMEALMNCLRAKAQTEDVEFLAAELGLTDEFTAYRNAQHNPNG